MGGLDRSFHPGDGVFAAAGEAAREASRHVDLYARQMAKTPEDERRRKSRTGTTKTPLAMRRAQRRAKRKRTGR